METPNDLLTTQEMDLLIVALCQGQGGCTTPEAEFVAEWARKVRLNSIILDLVLNGTPDADTHAVIQIVAKVNVETKDVAISIAKGAPAKGPLETSR